MNGRPAHEPRTHFPLRAVSWLQLSWLLLLACLPACWPCWLADATRWPAMQGRRGHQGPHRGQGSRRAALGDCGAHEVLSSLASRDSRTYTHTHPPTHTAMAPGERAPTLHTEADLLYMLPPSFRRATLPYSSRTYSHTYSRCVHMRQTGSLWFHHCPLCSSDCLVCCCSLALDTLFAQQYPA